MAREIIAAFRTVMLFISLSWLSVMYLLVYRVPKIEESNNYGKYEVIENVMGDRREHAKRLPASILVDGNVQLFGEDSSGMKLDLSNPANVLRIESDANGLDLQTPSVLTNPGRGTSQLYHVDKVSDSFDCRQLEKIRTMEVLGTGYTKVVRRGVLNGRSYALKYTTSKNHDIIKCTNERPKERHFECYNLAKFKLLKEAQLFSQLRHRNIIKVYGLCPWTANDVDSKESVLTVITEIGKPMDLIKMIQIPWDIRLKISIDLVDLLIFLDASSLGTLLIKDFRIEQLVLKDGTLKLTDLDDLDGRKKSCDDDRDCIVGNSLLNTTVPCMHQRCQNYSRTTNLYNLHKIFLDYSLNFDNPAWISNYLRSISKRVASFQIGLEELRSEFQKIVRNIKNGIYESDFIKRARSKTNSFNFETFSDAAIIGSNFDYYCIGSRSLTSCEMVVSDIEVVKITCAMSNECKAIVVKPEKNWLGQSIVVFKNSGRSLTPITRHTTFVKMS